MYSQLAVDKKKKLHISFPDIFLAYVALLKQRVKPYVKRERLPMLVYRLYDHWFIRLRSNNLYV